MIAIGFCLSQIVMSAATLYEKRGQGEYHARLIAGNQGILFVSAVALVATMLDRWLF